MIFLLFVLCALLCSCVVVVVFVCLSVCLFVFNPCCRPILSSWQINVYIFDAPVGVTPLEFCWDFWHQKTVVPALSYDVIGLVLRLAVFAPCRLITDRRTDKHTTYRCIITTRGKNGLSNCPYGQYSLISISGCHALHVSFFSAFFAD